MGNALRPCSPGGRRTLLRSTLQKSLCEFVPKLSLSMLSAILSSWFACFYPMLYRPPWAINASLSSFIMLYSLLATASHFLISYYSSLLNPLFPVSGCLYIPLWDVLATQTLKFREALISAHVVFRHPASPSAFTSREHGAVPLLLFQGLGQSIPPSLAHHFLQPGQPHACALDFCPLVFSLSLRALGAVCRRCWYL